MAARLFGREVELGQLLDALDRGPAVVRGLPGIGKSALLAAALSQRPAALALRGVAPLTSIPYLPVRIAVPDLDLSPTPATLADHLVRPFGPDALIAVEDLHWCDVDTLGLVEELAFRRPLVVTARSAPGPADGAVEAIAAHGEVIELGGLADADAAALVRSLRPGASPSDVERCVAAGKGNPLDLHLLATGRSHGPDGADRAALAVARVAAGPLDVLAGLAVAPGPVAIDPLVARELEAHGLVVEGPPGRWQPRHDRIARAAMAAVDPARLKALHAEQAAASTDPAMRAIHLAAAGDTARAAVAAAQAADEAPTLASRAEFLRLAAECTLPASVDASQAAAEALSLVGRYREALDLLRATPAAGRGAAGALIRARSHWTVSEIDPARQAIDEGLAACGPADGDLASELLALRSRILCRVDWDLAGAIGAADEAIAQASGPGRSLLAARSARGQALLISGDPRWAAELEEASRMAVAEEDLHDAVVLYDTLFFSHLLAGEPGRCPAIAAEAIAATEHSSAAWNGYFRAVALLAAVHVTGDHGAALAEGDVLARRTLTVKAEEAARTARVFALVDAGRDLDAVELAELSLERASDESSRSTAAWALAESAWLAGEAERAVEVANASLDLGITGLPGTVMAALVGQWARIHLELPPDERLAEATTCGLANCAGAALEVAGVGHLVDQPERAVDEFEAAAAAWRGRNIRAHLRSVVGASLAANRAGQAERAARHLRVVEHEAARLDIVWLRRRVATELRRTGLAPEVAPPRWSAGAEVLARVARGQVSQAISRSLQVTPATIESHVRVAMRRTGARTRLQAAALAGAVDAGPKLHATPRADGSVSIRSGPVPDGTPRVALGTLPPTPWTLASPVVVTGTVTHDADLTAVVLAAARGALLDVEVPPGPGPALPALIDGLGQVGRPVESAAAGRRPLSAEDAALVALLAAGATVTEAASELGYSRRTVQRRLAGLRQATGANTNREAVLLAAGRG